MCGYKVTERSNNFAVTSSDLSDALERSASVLANSGTSFEEYLGLVTAGTEITRDADKVANGLKTISLRLQGMTDEGEEDLELMASLGPAFEKIGVSIQDSEGNMRSTYDILKDMAVAFEGLSTAEKAYYTELAAGKYQAQTLTAILSNFQSAIDATSTALDSNGSALKENEAYLDSIAGRISILQSEFQKLSYTTINSDFIKGVIELGTNVLKLINNLGGLVPILSTILGFVSLYKSAKLTNLITDIVSALGQLGPSLTNVKKNFSAFISLIKEGNGILNSFGTLIGGVGGAIGVALIAIGAITGAISSYNNRQKELMQNAEESIQSFNEVSSSIEDVKQQYLNILDSTDSYTDKQEQLAELQETLIKQYGLEEEAVRNLNLERENGLELLSEEIKKNAEKTMSETGSQYRKAKKAITEGVWGTSANQTIAYAPVSDLQYSTDVDGTLEATSQEVEKLTEKFNFLKATIEDTGGQAMVNFVMNTEDMYDKSEKLEEVIAYLEERSNSFAGSTELEASLLEYLSSELEKVSSVIDENGSVFEGYNEAFAEYIKNSEKFSTANIESEDQFYDWSEAILEAAGSNEYAKEILEDYVEEVGIALGYIDDYSDETEKTVDLIGALTGNLETAVEQMEGIASAYNTMSNAVTEYNENGYITIDTLNKLLALDTDYLANLDLVNGKLTLNTDKLGDQVEALKVAAIQQLQAAAAADILAYANGDVESMSDAAKTAVSDLGEDIETAGSKASTAAGEMVSFAAGVASILESAGGDVDLSKIRKQADAITAVYEEIGNSLTNINVKTTYPLSGSSGSSKKSSSSKKETDPLEEQSKIFKEQVDQMEHELFIMEKLGATEDERIQKNKELQKLVHSQAEWFRSHGAGEDSEYIRDLQEQYWGYQDEIKSIEDEITEKNLEAFKDRLQISEDYIEDKNFYDNWGADNEIAAWQRVLKWMKEEYFDKGLISWEEYSENVREINKNIWEAQQEAAEEALEKQKESLEAQQEALEKQQEALEATFSYMADQIQNEIDALEEQKSQIEDFYDKEIEKIEEKNEAQEEANEKLEKEIALKEAQEALERAKSQKTMRVYYEGVGWQWEADRDAVSEAEQAVEDAKKDLEDLEREEAMEAEIDRLEKLKDEALANIDEQIDGWEKYKEEWSSVADNYEDEQDRLLAEQVLGIELEGDNWKTRLDNLQGYADQYISILQQIQQAQESIDALENGSQSSSASSGGSGSSSVSGSKPGSINDGKVTVSKPGYPGEVSVDYNPTTGKVTSEGLKPGDVVHTQGGDFEITGGTGGNYTSKPVSKKSYSSGGIVDYTGNANVHGSKSRPEIVLNNEQAATLYNWIRGGTRTPKIDSNVLNKNSGVMYNFSGAAFNISTNANNFESLISDIKIKIMNR